MIHRRERRGLGEGEGSHIERREIALTVNRPQRPLATSCLPWWHTYQMAVQEAIGFGADATSRSCRRESSRNQLFRPVLAGCVPHAAAKANVCFPRRTAGVPLGPYTELETCVQQRVRNLVRRSGKFEQAVENHRTRVKWPCQQ